MHTLSGDVRGETAQLQIDGLEAGYGSTTIIRDVNMAVMKGEVVTVIGPNGAGKSTLVKAVIGVLRPFRGAVCLMGEEITHLPAEWRARRGVGYVPQSRNVFPQMTVRENLEIGGYTLPRGEVAERTDEVMRTYPALVRLAGRRAGSLSGGEAKMVAIGRALMTRPSLVILDEPTAALSPPLAHSLLEELVPRLTASGAGVLMVEQRAVEALAVANWAYVMAAGTVQLSQAAREMQERDDIGQMLLGRTASVGET
jgi:branched-chain amino acid transport system ATP-binding protein